MFDPHFDFRRMTLEAKRAGKPYKKTGGASAAPRLIEINEHEPKYDFGMRPPLPAAPSPMNRSPKSELLSPKREPPSPSTYYIKEEPMSPGGLPFNNMSLSEIRQVERPLHHRPRTSPKHRLRVCKFSLLCVNMIHPAFGTFHATRMNNQLVFLSSHINLLKTNECVFLLICFVVHSDNVVDPAI